MIKALCALVLLISQSSFSANQQSIIVLSSAASGDPWTSALLQALRLEFPNKRLQLLAPHSDIHLEPAVWITTDPSARMFLQARGVKSLWEIQLTENATRARHEVLTQSPNFALLLSGLARLSEGNSLWISPQSRSHPLFEEFKGQLRSSPWTLAQRPEQAQAQVVLDPLETATITLSASPWRHHLGRGVQLGGNLDGQKAAAAFRSLLGQEAPPVPRMITLVDHKLLMDTQALSDLGLPWRALTDTADPIDWAHLRNQRRDYQMWFLIGIAVASTLIATLVAQNLSQRRARQQTERAITHDRTTGLFNHEGFRSACTGRIEDAPHRLYGLALVRIEAGKSLRAMDRDRLLQLLAQRLEGHTESGDVLGRTDAGEFAVLMEQVDVDRLGILMDQLCRSLEMPIFLNREPLHIHAGIGVVLLPDHTDEIDDAMNLARQSAWKAGRIGAVEWTLYNQSLAEDLQQAELLAADLRLAIAEERLNLVYQPIVRLRDQTIIGAESLLRWQHPTQGAISPPDIIELARQSDQIMTLGSWVLKTAINQAVRWQHLGLELKVNVNVAPEQFGDSRFAAQVQHLLYESGLNPGRLTLEITEDATLAHPTQAINTLNRMHQIGVRTAIDDFGTGYSSLSRLKQLKLNALKIDRSFVMDLVEDSNDRAINRAIIQIAQTMGLEVVAEGIETQDQLNLLLTEGCDYGQGYLFSKPVEAQQLIALMKQPIEALSA